MNTALRLGIFRTGFVALTLPASCAAFAAGSQLGTVFYSSAERAAITATRSGTQAKTGEASYYAVTGIVKREGGKSVAWINGKPVSEKPQVEGAPPISVSRDGVLIDGKHARVGETLDTVSGDRSSTLPPDAVTVIK